MGVYNGVELDDLELVGDRVVLRPWRPDDAAAVHAILRDGALHRWIPLPDPYTEQVAASYVRDIAAAGRRAATALTAAIVRSGTGELVGSCDLRLGEHPDIGYWVAPAAQGHGYAAEACRVLADWGFANGLVRIEISCDVRNLASVRTALAAGFRREGVSRAWGHRPVDERAAGPDPFDAARFARLAGDPGDPVPPAFAPLPEGRLADGVLALRMLRPEDAPQLAEAEDDVSVGWSFDGTPFPMEKLERTCADAGLDWLAGSTAQLAMVDIATGEFAGKLDVRRGGPPDVGGIGYVVHPKFRGRSYTTRALRLVSAWAFEVAGFARLELGAKKDNVASQRAAASAGFEPEGVSRARLRNPDGTYSDEVRFELINPRHR